MKSIKLIIGGNYFTSPNVRFFESETLLKEKDRIIRDTVDWDRVESKVPCRLDADRAVVFGLKTWTRRARKHFKRTPNEIIDILKKFLTKSIGSCPLGIVDDLALDEEKQFGDRIRSMIFNNFDCRFYLLRETFRGHKYDKRVSPFTMPCNDYTSLSMKCHMKNFDVFFRGNSSTEDRVKSFNAIKHMGNLKNDMFMYDGGDHAKERLTFDAYLKRMSDARFCLHFAGTGYCCFRYQEIASVGSIIVSPRYPHIILNDYEDMKSCLLYDSSEDLKRKITEIIKSNDKIQDMQDASICNFLSYHTTDKRAMQFLDAISNLEK